MKKKIIFLVLIVLNIAASFAEQRPVLGSSESKMYYTSYGTDMASAVFRGTTRNVDPQKWYNEDYNSIKNAIAHSAPATKLGRGGSGPFITAGCPGVARRCPALPGVDLGTACRTPKTYSFFLSRANSLRTSPILPKQSQ